MAPLLLAGLISQGVSSAMGVGSGLANLFAAKKIKPQYTPYERSKYASQMLGQAQMGLNSQRAGATAQRRGLLGSQANATAAAQRNATDPSQILAIAAGLAGQADQSLADAAAMDANWYQQNMNNLMQAQNANISEDRMLYEDKMRKWEADMSLKNAFRNSGQQSIVNGLGNFAGAAFAGADLMQRGKQTPTTTTPRFSPIDDASFVRQNFFTQPIDTIGGSSGYQMTNPYSIAPAWIQPITGGFKPKFNTLNGFTKYGLPK